MDFRSADTVEGEVTAFGNGSGEFGLCQGAGCTGAVDFVQSGLPIGIEIIGNRVAPAVAFQLFQGHVEYGHEGIMPRIMKICQRKTYVEVLRCAPFLQSLIDPEGSLRTHCFPL